MSEIEVVITVFMFTFTGLMLIIVGELCGNKALNSGHDVEYEKPDEPQKPPIVPNTRSFGNERPPREMRKPPMGDKRASTTQSEHDFLWLTFYAKGMENDTLLEDKSEEFKAGYSEAMKDVRWGIDHINEFHKYGELTDE